jgi:hypothetical protein
VFVKIFSAKCVPVGLMDILFSDLLRSAAHPHISDPFYLHL